jgi:hypothetical protein
MYDRNDVPFYVLTTDPEQEGRCFGRCVDCAGQDGRTWRGVRASPGIVREYATESAFDRSFIIYHKYKPILCVRHFLDVDHVVIGAERSV